MEGNFLITGAAQGFGKEFTRRVLKSKYLSFSAIIKITLTKKHKPQIVTIKLGGGRVLLSDKNPVGGEETNKAFQEVCHHHHNHKHHKHERLYYTLAPLCLCL